MSSVLPVFQFFEYCKIIDLINFNQNVESCSISIVGSGITIRNYVIYGQVNKSLSNRYKFLKLNTIWFYTIKLFLSLIYIFYVLIYKLNRPNKINSNVVLYIWRDLNIVNYVIIKNSGLLQKQIFIGSNGVFILNRRNLLKGNKLFFSSVSTPQGLVRLKKIQNSKSNKLLFNSDEILQNIEILKIFDRFKIKFFCDPIKIELLNYFFHNILRGSYLTQVFNRNLLNKFNKKKKNKNIRFLNNQIIYEVIYTIFEVKFKKFFFNNSGYWWLIKNCKLIKNKNFLEFINVKYVLLIDLSNFITKKTSKFIFKLIKKNIKNQMFFNLVQKLYILKFLNLKNKINLIKFYKQPNFFLTKINPYINVLLFNIITEMFNRKLNVKFSKSLSFLCSKYIFGGNQIIIEILGNHEQSLQFKDFFIENSKLIKCNLQKKRFQLIHKSSQNFNFLGIEIRNRILVCPTKKVFLSLIIKGYIKFNSKPLCVGRLIHLTHVNILNHYLKIYNKFTYHYRFTKNYKYFRSKTEWFLKTSCALTLAKKFKISTVQKIFKRFGYSLNFRFNNKMLKVY